MQRVSRIAVKFSISQCRALLRSTSVPQSTKAQSALIHKFEIPPPDGVNKPMSPKIDKIAAEISQLNLLEVSELSSLLKARLNLPDAPAFPVGGFVPTENDEEPAVPPKVQTAFTVRLMKYDEKQKVALIKEIKKLMDGMNLVQAKKFVESSPTVVMADISKDEADKLKYAIENVGGLVEVD